MAGKYPVSVFIIAKNEEDRIGHSIRSVRDWVDEVIVIDSGSTDNTVALSKELGASVVYNEWQGYGSQKIFGESLCHNNWILNIDADEAVDTSLKSSIEMLFSQAEIPCKAYHLNIKIMPNYAKKPGKFAPSNDPIRLYDKRYAGFKSSTVHDSVVMKEGHTQKAGKLEGIVIHRCFRSLSHAVEKINFYSSMQAEDMLSRGKNPSLLRLLIEPFFAFFKAYILRRYWLLGASGYVESIVYSFARTLRLAKAREAFQRKQQLIAVDSVEKLSNV